MTSHLGGVSHPLLTGRGRARYESQLFGGVDGGYVRVVDVQHMLTLTCLFQILAYFIWMTGFVQ